MSPMATDAANVSAAERAAASGDALVAVVGGTDALTDLLARGLRQGGLGPEGISVETGPKPAAFVAGSAVVYLAAARGDRHAASPDLPDAEAVLRAAADSALGHLLVVSSSAVHEPSAHHPQRLDETALAPRRTDASFASQWRALEQLATGHLAGEVAVTILRPTPVVTPGGGDFWSRLFGRPVAFTVPGYDPVLQLLAAEDLARAVVACLLRPPDPAGIRVFHVAPAAVIPLREALRRSRTTRLPVPRAVQRPIRTLLSPRGLAAPGELLESLRHPSTVDASLIRRRLGFSARSSSRALETLGRAASRDGDRQEEDFDPFGLDVSYIRRLSATLFRFLHDVYWRIEYRGLEHVPVGGPAVLAGVHRGFQPWDGVMAMHKVALEHGRFMRFLVHPTLIKHPFLTPYMQKLGGVPACRENGDWVLDRGELLAIFPEGIRGAFRLYDRKIYQLGRFGREEFVRFAVRHQAPIVPFVTVGSAEIFPILRRFRWSWWRRHVEWPYFPLTPTLGLLPLPSKWHTRFLEPLPVEEYPPSAAEDPRLVRRLSLEVRRRMNEALDEMVERRRHIFWGSIFNAEPPRNADDPATGETAP